MAVSGYFVDSTLLVLLVVGNAGRELVAKHRRLRRYTAADYDVLVAAIGRAGRIFVTPNTLTETSNLLGQHGEPERSVFFGELESLINESEEIAVVSADAAANRDFQRLGLADAALLEVAAEETPLLTADVGLYLSALGNDARGAANAVNFAHLRGL